MKIVLILLIYVYLNALSYDEYKMLIDNNNTASFFKDANINKEIRFDPILFKDGEIQEDNQEYLDEMAGTIKIYLEQKKDVCIVILSHTSLYLDKLHELLVEEDDNISSNKEKNKRFSKKIKDYFITNGVDSSKIFIQLRYSEDKKDSNTINNKDNLSNKTTVTMYIKENPDKDNDGVVNNSDKCPNTPIGTRIDEYGCKYKTLIVLLDNKSKKNAIEVRTRKGSGVINKANSYTKLSSSNSVVNIHPSLPEDEIKDIFGDVLAVDYDKDRKDYTLHFNSSTELTEESEQKMEEVITFLKNNKASFIKVIGHTDTKGNKSLNIRLAQKRANYIAKIINSNNISYDLLDTVSYGEFDLAIKTDDNTDEALNRRVEILIR
jgi:outer membrane protein OmpA-like peptidoglycan-associated protein